MAELLALADDDGRQRWESLTLGYTETRGMPALREEIARTYENVQPEDVLCFAGAEEAIYLAMHVLLDPGDHAVVLTPNYQAAETIPLSICEVTGVRPAARGRLGPGRRRDRGRAPADHPPGLRQLPQQPHRRRTGRC